MRLTLIISSVQDGGAERVISIMANYWVARGWEITLLTLDDGSASPFYYLDPRIRLVSLGLASISENAAVGLIKNMNRVHILRRAIRDSNPDAVISFMDRANVITLLAAQGLGIPVIVSERSNPALNPIGKVWKRLRSWTYPHADLLVVQSKGTLDYFSSHMTGRVSVIPNPVLQPQRNESSTCINCTVEETPGFGFTQGRSVIAMGRLSREKGFDFLMQAFAHLKPRHEQWSLTILGEGPQREELESLRLSLLLEGSVSLPGRVDNPNQFLTQATLFVLSSRFEGFPNALCEAMACGLPVISTDCPYGPQDIVRHDIDGLLIPSGDVNELINTMNRLMTNEKERQRLAARAPEVIDRFGVDKVMRMWEAALHSLVHRRPGHYA